MLSQSTVRCDVWYALAMKSENGKAPEQLAWSGRAKAGAALVVVSIVPWLCVAALPFVEAQLLPWGKVATAGALVVAGEAMQLIGIAIAGPDLWARLRSAVKGWEDPKK